MFGSYYLCVTSEMSSSYERYPLSLVCLDPPNVTISLNWGTKKNFTGVYSD